MTRPPAAPALLAAAAALAAAGCQTNPGAAAIVGGTPISVDRLAGMVQRALADPQVAQAAAGNRAAFERQELSRLIGAQVVAAAARRAGVTVSETQVDQRLRAFEAQAGGAQALRRQAAQAGIASADLREFVRTVVLQDALAAKLGGQGGTVTQLRIRTIQVKGKRLADSILAQVRRDPSRFPALAKRYSTDTASKARGGDLGYVTRGQLPQQFAAAVFAAPPGAILEVNTNVGWQVVQVLGRRTVPRAQADPQGEQQRVQQLLGRALSAEAARLGVRVNPRFGSWDPRQGSVAAPAELLSTPAPDAAGSGR